MLGEAEPDLRLRRYLIACRELADAETLGFVEQAESYYEQLSRMLELARRLPPQSA